MTPLALNAPPFPYREAQYWGVEFEKLNDLFLMCGILKDLFIDK